MRLDCRQQMLCLTVSDQGRGFDPQNVQETAHGGRYLGLLGMQERLRLIGGRLLVDSSAKGTTIKAEVPLGEGNMTAKCNVLVCDDHAIFREGLKMMLSADAQMQIVGEASTGLQAVEMAKNLRPDLIVMDIAMPEQNGIEATKQILELLPRTRVVILSVHSRKTFIIESLKAGARGYVLKDSAGEKLLDAVDAVLKGECYLDSPVAGHIVDEFISLPEIVQSDSAVERLTDRERQVLVLIVEGKHQQNDSGKTLSKSKDGG